MLKGHAAIVYQIFLDKIRLTDIDILKITKLNPNSVRPVRLKLEKMNLIKRTDKKKTHTINSKKSKYTIYQLNQEQETETKNKSVLEQLKSIKEKIDKIINSI